MIGPFEIARYNEVTIFFVEKHNVPIRGFTIREMSGNKSHYYHYAPV